MPDTEHRPYVFLLDGLWHIDCCEFTLGHWYSEHDDAMNCAYDHARSED